MESNKDEELKYMLGKIARDCLTGLSGKITGYAYFLYGNPTVCISNTAHGQIHDNWIDIGRIVLTSSNLPDSVLCSVQIWNNE